MLSDLLAVQVRRNDAAFRELEDERDLLREQLAQMDGIVRLQERRCRVMEEEIQELHEDLQRTEDDLARCRLDLSSKRNDFERPGKQGYRAETPGAENGIPTDRSDVQLLAEVNKARERNQFEEIIRAQEQRLLQAKQAAESVQARAEDERQQR